MSGADETRVLKRFYSEVSVAPVADGYEVRLDGKAVRSRSGQILRLPARALAEAIAQEWEGQDEKLDFASLPLTQLGFIAIDATANTMVQTREAIAKFAGSDLICYRAEHPEALVKMEAELWDPVLHWVNETHGTEFVVVKGITFTAQPEESLNKIARHIDGFDAFQLTALKSMTEITGSLILALATAAEHLPWEAAWQAAQVDEEWQRGQWGADKEATAVSDHKRSAFTCAARFFALLRQA